MGSVPQPDSDGSSGSSEAPGGGLLPLQLRVGGRRCVVVGAGPVGTRRARALLDAGAQVVVVAPDLSEAVQDLADAGELELHRRELRPGDLDGAVLVVAATGVVGVDDQVASLARAAGALVNRADDAALGDVAFPAVVRRGPVTVAVSSAGRAPAAARWLAERLDGRLDELIGLGPEGYGELVAVVEEVRAELARRRRSADAREGGVTPGALDWRRALDASILDLIDQGRLAEAKERLLACLSSS